MKARPTDSLASCELDRVDFSLDGCKVPELSFVLSGFLFPHKNMYILHNVILWTGTSYSTRDGSDINL